MLWGVDLGGVKQDPIMISQKEFEKVSELNPEKRLSYLIKRIADFEEVWLLYNDADGYALNEETDGSDSFPVWPFKVFSDVWIEGEFSRFTSKKVTLELLLNSILPKLEEQQIRILAFPTDVGEGVLLKCAEFRELVEDELSQY